MDSRVIEELVFWAGMGHFGLCAGSLLIPRVLQWQKNLSPLRPFYRQMFWTYAGYILVINCCFGIVSTVGPSEMLDHSFLARSLTIFIAVYWLTRILIQFFYFDKSDAPKGFRYTLGEIALVTLFVFFAVVYSLAFIHNLS